MPRIAKVTIALREQSRESSYFEALLDPGGRGGGGEPTFNQCKRWTDRDWIGIHQSTNPRLIHWWRGYGSRSNSHPFVALLRQCCNILRLLIVVHPLNNRH